MLVTLASLDAADQAAAEQDIARVINGAAAYAAGPAAARSETSSTPNAPDHLAPTSGASAQAAVNQTEASSPLCPSALPVTRPVLRQAVG